MAYISGVKRLRKYLDDTKTSQKDFARQCGVSQPTVSDWVTGEIMPSIEKLKIMSNVTGLSIDELLDHEPPRHADSVAHSSV